MSQAISLMPALNGYGTLTEEVDADGNNVITQDTAAMTFVTEGLSKVLKINNICDFEHISDCGIPKKISPVEGSALQTANLSTMKDYNIMFGGSKDFLTITGSFNFFASYSQLNAKAVAFETANRESILAYYYPRCIPFIPNVNNNVYIQKSMCANFIYDLNGRKGPNTMGKDIGFISVLYPLDSVVVAPMPARKVHWANDTTYFEAQRTCKLDGENYRLPTLEELGAMFYNKALLPEDLFLDNQFWSTHISNTQMWIIRFADGLLQTANKNGFGMTFCIKR